MLSQNLSGVKTPGWKKVKKYGSKTWAKDEQSIIDALKERGIDESEVVVPKILTASQALKRFPKNVMSDLVCRFETGVQLVPEDSKKKGCVEFSEFSAIDKD